MFVSYAPSKGISYKIVVFWNSVVVEVHDISILCSHYSYVLKILQSKEALKQENYIVQLAAPSSHYQDIYHF